MLVSPYSAHIAAINLEGKILLVKRRDVPVWVIPGGGGEKGETTKQTALREFREETGVDLENQEIYLAARYRPFQRAGRYKFLYYTYVSELLSLSLTEESSDYNFFKLSELPQPMSLYERKRIFTAFKAIVNQVSIEKTDHIDTWSEILHQLKNPLRALYLIGLVIIRKSN
jgi:8-oxo-dGTP diphosphatase